MTPTERARLEQLKRERNRIQKWQLVFLLLFAVVLAMPLCAMRSLFG